MAPTRGSPTPQAMVADNDLAVGQIVEALTQSRSSGRRWRFSWWKTTRRTAWITWTGIARWRWRSVRTRGAGTSIRRSIRTQSMVKTIELMLGLPTMSLFDLIAEDMRASFQAERGSDAVSAR